MSETDSFIQEVTEEVRQDQMYALWKKWAPYVIGGVVVVVGGAATWSWMQTQEQAEAEKRGGIFINADPEVVEQQTALPDQIDGPAKFLAELTAAAALAEAGDTEEAGKIYAGLAGRADLPVEYRDLARLQAIRVDASEIDGDAALAEMAGGTGPYRLLAMELQAVRMMEDGDAQSAFPILNNIIVDPLATNGLRQRAAALLTAAGGQIDLSGEDNGS